MKTAESFREDMKMKGKGGEDRRSEDEAVFVGMATWRSQQRRRGLGGDWTRWDGGSDGDATTMMRWRQQRRCGGGDSMDLELADGSLGRDDKQFFFRNFGSYTKIDVGRKVDFGFTVGILQNQRRTREKKKDMIADHNPDLGNAYDSINEIKINT